MKLDQLLCCCLLSVVGANSYWRPYQYYRNTGIDQYNRNADVNQYNRNAGIDRYNKNTGLFRINQQSPAPSAAINETNNLQSSTAAPIDGTVNALAHTGIKRGILQLAVLLDCVLSPKATGANILFSPLNLIETLTILMKGTSGKTENELKQFLVNITRGKQKFNGDSPNKLDIYKSMSNILNDITADQNLKTANAIFVQNGYNIKQEYVDFTKNYFNTSVHNVDFSAGGVDAVAFINQWVSNNTNDRIKEIIQPPLDSLTKLIITSALYFNGNWEYPFSDKITKWQPFYLGKDGKFGVSSVKVQMMVNEAKISYYENKIFGLQSIGLPYKNKETIMFIVLPKINVSLAEIAPCTKIKIIQEIVENKAQKEVMYVIPKMVLDFKVDLRSILQRRVKTLFDPENANFSNLIDDKIHVSEILHKVEINVNEVGTIAAAATSTSIPRGGFINFRADRPFLFFIYNVKNDVITFWANVQKPTPFVE